VGGFIGGRDGMVACLTVRGIATGGRHNTLSLTTAAECIHFESDLYHMYVNISSDLIPPASETLAEGHLGPVCN